LRGIKTKGEDNDDHRSLSFVFHRNDDWEEKNHEDDSYMPSFSCLKGAGIRGEDNNNFCDHCHLLFFKNTMPCQGEKKTMKTTFMCHHFCV
jgi:hypothetical protein